MNCSQFIPAAVCATAVCLPQWAASQTINGFTIVNADTGADIVTVKSSATVSLAATPRINVRANATNVGSVVFTDGSTKHTEDAVPYAYKGNSGPTYNAWAPVTGTYSINAAPFAGSGGAGAAGSLATLTLKVIGATAPPPQDGQVVTYLPDNTTDFINPERGWMDRFGKPRFAGARAGDDDNPVGYSVVWTDVYGVPWNGVSGNPFRLDNYRVSRLPGSLLDALRNEFTTARAAGIKLKVRFAYNYVSNGTDTSKEWMLTHIGQLGPVLTANADTIASMDAGFVGKWGEMHSSSHIVSASGGDPEAATAEVVQALLSATPDNLSVRS